MGATPQLLLKCSLALTTSLTSCTLNAPSFIGMLARVWKRENSLRRVKILLLWRRTTKRWALKLLRVRVKKRATATSSEHVAVEFVLHTVVYLLEKNQLA